MKNVAAVTCITVCLLICFTAAKANLPDSIPSSNSLYERPIRLFVQTDKHVYTNREYLWFSALLELPRVERAAHNILCIALVPADTRIPALHRNYIMIDGYSYGSLRLPDTIAPGEYKLVAFTNLIDKDSIPAAVYTKDLTIHSTLEANFVGAATLLEDGKGLQDLLITVRDKTTSKPVRDAELTIWRGHSKMIQAKTDKDGVFRQSLHAFDADSLYPIVNVKIWYKSETQFLQKIMTVPEKERQLRLHFFPEGGQLLPGTLNRVGWQSITDQGEPVPIKAAVYKDQQPIDTLLTDEWGMGAFLLTPEAGAVYTIKVLQSPPGVKLPAEGSSLPAVMNKGLGMHVSQAVTGDSLGLEIWSAGYSTVRLVVHDFKTVFIDGKYPIAGHKRMLILLNEVPKGLAAVTLYDEQDRPLAERIFFAHYDKKTTVSIQPDKKEYGKRQKVTLSLQLTDQQGMADSGYATISCVQASRMLPARQQDLESWAYLEAPLQNGSLLNKRYGNTNWMEHVLLMHGQRKWREHDHPAFFSPVFTGHVSSDEGKIKKPQTVMIMGNQGGASVITTAANGQFQLSYDDLLALQDRKLMITANSKNSLLNRVAINDPFEAIGRKLADRLDFHTVDAGKYVQYAYNLFTKDLSQAKQLASVTVTARVHENNNLYSFGSNLCGDYVCKYNVLNCPNHPGEPDNRPPIKGHQYNTPGRGQTIYWGCVREDLEKQPRAIEYEGIKIGNLFEPEDFSVNKNASPEYISTLYFSPVLLFDVNGKAECSFYTSDITGPFRIVVNGATGNNFFYGMATIEVK